MKVQLEHVGSAFRMTVEVDSLKDQVWRRTLGGSHDNIRLMDALYTYSRTENGVPIFRYRWSREISQEFTYA